VRLAASASDPTLRDGKVAKFLALEDTAAHVVALDAG
jgi:hypothetical protein